jgi:hypothetical protein
MVACSEQAPKLTTFRALRRPDGPNPSSASVIPARCRRHVLYLSAVRGGLRRRSPTEGAGQHGAQPIAP